MPVILDVLPELYKGMLAPPLKRAVPEETKATCASCTMLKGGCRDAVAPADGIQRLFHPDTKCCTFHPKLPNYLVGALLADERPELASGRARVRAKIDRRVAVTPQWLRAPAKYEVLYNGTRDAFGRAPSLKCPYYETAAGACTIWPYREAVCSTFFCKYVAGADGLKLWMSLKAYLSLVERVLSHHALLAIDREMALDAAEATPRTQGTLTLDDLEDRPPSDADYRKLWRDWVGREEELYLAAYEQVRRIDAEGLERLVGFDGALSLGVLGRALDGATRPRLPETLRLNPGLTLKHLDDGSVALGAYSELDGVALPREAHSLLAEFRGDEPVTVVRQRLRERHSADFADEILLALHQQRILI